MMRKEWFAFVKKIRNRLQRKDKSKNITHQTAMAEASKVWPAEKVKIQRRLAREEKKRLKEAKHQDEEKSLL